MTRVLTLVANSKMGEMTLSILTAEGHRDWVDSCAERAAAVSERMVERIRHPCQCWVRAKYASRIKSLPNEVALSEGPSAK